MPRGHPDEFCHQWVFVIRMSGGGRAGSGLRTWSSDRAGPYLRPEAGETRSRDEDAPCVRGQTVASLDTVVGVGGVHAVFQVVYSVYSVVNVIHVVGVERANAHQARIQERLLVRPVPQDRVEI